MVLTEMCNLLWVFGVGKFREFVEEMGNRLSVLLFDSRKELGAVSACVGHVLV
jgi:hypothetical protein